jgi:hypothetical protein
MTETSRATLKAVRIIQVAPLGTHAQVDIPGVGKKWIHQSGVHDDSEIYWEKKPDGKMFKEAGPGKLVLHGWYAKKVGIDED